MILRVFVEKNLRDRVGKYFILNFKDYGNRRKNRIKVRKIMKKLWEG